MSSAAAGWALFVACGAIGAGAGPLTHKLATAPGWQSPGAVVTVVVIATTIALVLVLSVFGWLVEL